MSFAIETKKRKFERILETLTDGSSPSSKPAARPRSISALSAGTANNNSLDSIKRRRVTPTSVTRLGNASTTSLSTHYLPSSRSAFLERLETFRNVTQWHIPSTGSLNAAEWAKRGWLCHNTDTVSCPACKERVLVDLETDHQKASPASRIEESENDPSQLGDLNSEEDQDPLMIANAIYEGLIKRYSEMIVTAHKDGCPWRRRGCDASIQRIEGLLNTTNATMGLRTRYQSIAKEPGEMPNVASLPTIYDVVIEEQELGGARYDDNEPTLDINTLKLALCGWQSKEQDVVECRHCFRSLGLWLYRGTDPTMEHLDPIDSHLDYCPWRSSKSQDTEVIIGHLPNKRKEALPGWLLVYLAVVKGNNRRRGPSNNAQARPLTAPGLTTFDQQQSDNGDNANPDTNFTPEQREKKMKDLLRRIKELKKPFNVKNLLRRSNQDKK